MTTTELYENLYRLRAILTIARRGNGSTAELERGIAEAEAELARREAILARESV